MHRLALATSVIALSIAVGVAGTASAATDGNLSLGQSCNGSQASLTVNINGGQGQQFDVLLDGNTIINGINGNSGTQVQVADGVHSISLVYAPDGVVQQATIGVSCGAPAVAAFEVCINAFGALHVISVPGTAGQLDLYIDGDLADPGLGDSTWGNDYEGFPDGTYLVGVKIAGQDNFVFQEAVEIDCVQGEQGQPATVDVSTWCDSPTIQLKLDSFTFGERFTITVDGTEKVSDVLFGYYSFDVAGTANRVVVTSSTHGVIFDDDILLACENPVATARATCEAGVGTLWFKSLANATGYSFFVSADGQPIAEWQDAGDTEGQWVSLGEFAEGDHNVFIQWYHVEAPDDSAQLVITVGCVDDGSGTPLPDSGSNTTPIMLLAGGFVLAGSVLLLSRRTRHA